MGTLYLLRNCTILKNIWKINYVTTRSALKLAHKIHGPSPRGGQGGVPVIVLHGLLGSKRNWDSMCQKITSATKKCVIAVDARNHGESPHHTSHTYLELASDVSQLITSLSVSKAAIIGHSMGGRTGMVLALSEPSKVASLVVVDISPVSTAAVLNNFFPTLIDAMKSINFQGISSISIARKTASEKIIASGLVKSMEGMGFVLMNIGTKSDKSIGWLCNLDALKEHFGNISTFPGEMTGKEYPGPTLFIGGEQSNYIPPGDINGIKKLFPQAELKYISGVGHNVHAEDPKSFFNMVVGFLSKI